MRDISKKFRWIEHPENNSLVQLQFNNCGMWFTLDGTTVNSVAEMVKYTIMDEHCKAILGISLNDIENNKVVKAIRV